MPTHLILLNGPSSSGKSTLARALQQTLPTPWLTFSIDTFVEALPARMQTGETGLTITPDGKVSVDAAFRELEAAWQQGIAAMANAGAHIIVDDVFLGGATSQKKWTEALTDTEVLWVGVRCTPAEAARREAARGDRVRGMAEAQANLVHQGVHYDMEIDTTTLTPEAAAHLIATHLTP